jgi:hypothetical protein
MSEPVVLSASSINTYLRCQQQWYYAYVMNIKSPPNVALLVGLSAHKAVETNMEQKVTSKLDLPVADVLDVFSTEYDAQVGDIENEDEDPGKGKDSGIDIVRLYHTTVAPPIQPALVEEQIQFSVNGIPYSTVLDLVEERIDPVFNEAHDILRELKTTKSTPTIDRYAIQMTGQSVGLKHKTGKEQVGVIVDVLVRTKTPKHIQIQAPELMKPPAIGMFADIVAKVHAQIQTGNFIPSGLTNRACSWCGYTNICPAYKYFGK